MADAGARRWPLADASATENLGAWLAARLRLPLCVYLHGPLGSGKTTLCRGLLQALGHRGAVRSPTYTLYERYALTGVVCLHCDFYRLSDPGEVEYLGLREQFGDDTLLLIEWPRVAAGEVPPPDLELMLDYAGTGRVARIEAWSVRGQAVISSGLKENL